jgi:enterobactin synthetase component D / holo-[acyl-carrier protein] synthase
VSAERIFDRFRSDVSICVASPAMYRGGLFPEEAALVADSVPKRCGEFTAGRNAARAALARFGVPGQPILRGPRGRPLWPAGFVGSITHCTDFCCAVAARSSRIRSLGLDAEEIARLEGSLACLVCRPEELAHFEDLPVLPTTNWEKLAFSAKEAFYKCHYPLTGEVLDFQDVSVRFSLDANRTEGLFQIARAKSATASAQPPVVGTWFIDAARIYAGALQPA